MPVLADVYVSALEGLMSQFYDIEMDLGLISGSFITIIGVAGVIWISAIAWRKFKETTNKV